MNLYHGSTEIVEKPLASYGRNNLDFGKGFYTTSMKNQAEKWVQRFILLGKKGYVNIYDYNDTEAALARLKYEKPNNQICFTKQKVLDAVLHFKSVYEVKGDNP